MNSPQPQKSLAKCVRHEMRRTQAGYPVDYWVFDNGQVVAYKREVDPGMPTDRGQVYWLASLWDKHPLDHESAEHLGHIAADSTWAEFMAAMPSWGLEAP